MNPDQLSQAAREVLAANRRGSFTVPSPLQYPHQWNWDSAVVAVGLSHFKPAWARDEIASLLTGQWADGMVPNIVFGEAPDYFPSPEFWQTAGLVGAPVRPTSGITQPPLLATCLRLVHQRHADRAFLAATYPAVLRWHRWFHTHRDADGSGLVALIHPWESGTDDSPRWLEVMSRITPHNLPVYTRRDTRHVAADQRPLQEDYDRYIYLVDLFRRARYEPRALLEQSPFLVQDVLFNAVLYRAHEDLRALGIELGEPVEEIEAWMDKMDESFNRRFWDDAAGLYRDFDLRGGAHIPVNTAATFAPLFGGLAAPSQARRLVEEHLDNPREYGRDGLLRYQVSSTSAAEPAWDAIRYWRGPVWPVVNWIIALGLQRAGYPGRAEAIRADTLALLEGEGFSEYFDPRDGRGVGAGSFSWSAALGLEMASGPLELPPADRRGGRT